MNRLQWAQGDVKRVIADELAGDEIPNEAVEGTLDFVRHWPGHHFPRLLAALQRLEEEIYPQYGLRPGSYAFYGSRVEQLFLPRFAAALEEYGLPSQIAMKVPGLLDDAESLDIVLARLSDARTGPEFTDFEASVLEDARMSL
jgi:hypothetical protein